MCFLRRCARALGRLHSETSVLSRNKVGKSVGPVGCRDVTNESVFYFFGRGDTPPSARDLSGLDAATSNTACADHSGCRGGAVRQDDGCQTGDSSRGSRAVATMGREQGIGCVWDIVDGPGRKSATRPLVLDSGSTPPFRPRRPARRTGAPHDCPCARCKQKYDSAGLAGSRPQAASDQELQAFPVIPSFWKG